MQHRSHPLLGKPLVSTSTNRHSSVAPATTQHPVTPLAGRSAHSPHTTISGSNQPSYHSPTTIQTKASAFNTKINTANPNTKIPGQMHKYPSFPTAGPVTKQINNNHQHQFNNGPVQPKMNPLYTSSTNPQAGAQHQHPFNSRPLLHSNPSTPHNNNPTVQPFIKGLMGRIFGSGGNAHQDAVVHHSDPHYTSLAPPRKPPPPRGTGRRKPPPPPRPSLKTLREMAHAASLSPSTNQRGLIRAAKTHYATDLPSTASTLNERGKVGVLEHLTTLNRSGRVNIEAQGKPDIPLQDFMDTHTLAQRKSHFAYRFKHRNQQEAKRRSRLSGGHISRVTLSVKPSHAQQLMDVMADAYTNTDLPEHFITGMKVMGPNNLGNRTDTAVIYLGGHDSDKATQVAHYFQNRLGSDAFYDHHPKGMEPLMRGISYSEFRDDYASSSHGKERSTLVAKAVRRQRRHTTASLNDVLAYTLHSSGYDADRPSRVRSASSRSIRRPW